MARTLAPPDCVGAHTSYLGYPVAVTDDGYVVNVDGTRVGFQSMLRLREFVKGYRRELRRG